MDCHRLLGKRRRSAPKHRHEKGSIDLYPEGRRNLSLDYKGTPLRQTYAPDFVCFGKIILEIKALAELTNTCRSQVHNYLKTTSFRLGLLVNFGHHPKVEYERIVR